MEEGERESGKRRAVLREGERERERESDDRYNRRGTRQNGR